jgi:hypothetical protein
MFLALLAFNICHPEKILRGSDSEYPRLTKEEKRMNKERRRSEKKENQERKKEEESDRASSGYEMV